MRKASAERTRCLMRKNEESKRRKNQTSGSFCACSHNCEQAQKEPDHRATHKLFYYCFTTCGSKRRKNQMFDEKRERERKKMFDENGS
jgi:hypothetical protein